MYVTNTHPHTQAHTQRPAHTRSVRATATSQFQFQFQAGYSLKNHLRIPVAFVSSCSSLSLSVLSLAAFFVPQTAWQVVCFVRSYRLTCTNNRTIENNGQYEEYCENASVTMTLEIRTLAK